MSAINAIYHYLMIEFILRKNSMGGVAYRFVELISNPEVVIRLGKKPGIAKILNEDLFYDWQLGVMFFCYRNSEREAKIGIIVDDDFNLPKKVVIANELSSLLLHKAENQLRHRNKVPIWVDFSQPVEVYRFHPRFRKPLAAGMKDTQHLDVVCDSIEHWALNQPDVVRNRILLVQAKERFKSSIVTQN